MGLRFRKTIRLNKWMRVNLSKSGVSFTLGGHGLSINAGRNGLFANASLPGTGISWRGKVADFNATNLNNRIPVSQAKENEDIVDQYQQQQELALNLHQYADNVATYDQFLLHLDSLTNQSKYKALEALMDGDEETINAMLDNLMASLKLPYEMDASYQLDDHTLYVDLNLPEIEALDNYAYSLSATNDLIRRVKSSTTMKQEYTRIALTLPIYMAARIFNITPYITTIVLSGFTTRRNNLGDPVDVYIYSIKFTRAVFEQTDLLEVDNPYKFIMNFVSRINLQNGYNFKEITPYSIDAPQPETIESHLQKQQEEAAANPKDTYIAEATEGLKNLGYKASEIKAILPDLQKMDLASSDAYLKEALRILLRNKSLDGFSL